MRLQKLRSKMVLQGLIKPKMKHNKLIIATRKSPLAMWQAKTVQQRLQVAHPKLEVELLGLTTQGDIHLATPLAEVGGKGLFIKELEQAILDGRADIAVHSIKDIPAEFPPGFCLATICQRDDARDAFISNQYQTLAELPLGATIGTSSLRRQCQLLVLRPDLNVKALRGNVQTRLQKLDDGDFDAIILAAAGLHRLNLAARISSYLDWRQSLPAIGQGAIGIECLRDDQSTQELLAPLDDTESRICISAEREFNYHLQGGCQVPIAGHAVLQNDMLYLRGLVGNPNGSAIIAGQRYGHKDQAKTMGKDLALELLALGADKIIHQSYVTHGSKQEDHH